jgi:serine/threonine-protein kinase
MLLESLGRGCYGAVHRGLIESAWGVRRPVAVKVFALAYDADADEAMHKLGGIARRAVCINHPSVVQVLEVDRSDDVGTDGPTPFKVMELVEGESLQSLVDGWRNDSVRVPVDFATIVTLRIAEALGAALFTDGADGDLTELVHGDLSPRQILISSQGEVKVGDFGESILCERSSHVRSRSRLAYTAPEVACGDPATARSDVFSLGVILHELLLGPRFGRGMSVADAIRMIQSGELHSNVLEPNLPRGLREIIERATQRDPADRYAHAHAMAFDLRREMLRLGLCDAQTCVRHAIVGWCDVDGRHASALQQSHVRSADLAPDVADARKAGAAPRSRIADVVALPSRRG